MSKKKLLRTTVLTALITALLLFAGCANQTETTTTTTSMEETTTTMESGTTTTTVPEYKGKKLVLAHPPWPGGTLKNYALKEVLEERFPGLTVELKQVSIALTFQGLQQGTVDLFIEDWVPHYLPKKSYDAREGIVNLGPNYVNAKAAWEIPTYTAEKHDIETVQDLKGKADIFGGKAYCIEPGSENCKNLERDVEEFNLTGYEVVASSTAGMAAQFEQRYKNNEPVLISGWHPLWLHYRFNITDLKDPTNRSYKTWKDHIDTIVTNDFKEKFGAKVYNVVDKIDFNEETSELMYYKEQGMSKKEAAHKWVTENQDKIDSWFTEGEDEHEWCKHIGNEDMQGCPENIAIDVYGLEEVFEARE